MIKIFRYQLLLFFALLVGAFILHSILTQHKNSLTQKRENDLVKKHEETVLRIETGLEMYATVVSSIRAFVQNSTDFPTEKQLQSFLQALTAEIDFQDSMVVSWIDSNHVFQYVVTPNQIDPNGLKGKKVNELRPESEIELLNEQMLKDNINLYRPINLIEGWAAFPFNFAVKNADGKTHGYFAPVINVKYLFNYPYKMSASNLFFHRFSFDDSTDVTREAVYDGTKIYNNKRDPEHYKNYITNESHFVKTSISVYGLELEIATAYKETKSENHALAILTYSWYALLCLFSILSVRQYIRNKNLNRSVKFAHDQIAIKNNQLEKNIESVQILIKEIHHRVKNNLQIISSLMNIQRNSSDNSEINTVLDASRGRIQSMALVHQKLYGNETLIDVNVKEYVEQLIASVEYTLEISHHLPEKRVMVQSTIFLNMDTMIPLGLIINELVTNSYKYAFSESGENWINTEVLEEKDFFQLIYSDSGSGIPKHITPSDSGTLGLELIHILAEQLNGSVQYENSQNSTFIVRFKKI